MDEYRRLQAEKWKAKSAEVQEPSSFLNLVPQLHAKSVNIDSSSLNSIVAFLKSSGLPRTGILFGEIEDEVIVVDAIYELSQDVITGQVLFDSRLSMIRRVITFMGLKPLGILINSRLPEALARVCVQDDFLAHIILMISQDGDEIEVFEPLEFCFLRAKDGSLNKDTTLNGPTVNGGFFKKDLVRSLSFTTRQVNTIIHTGFYRLNRPDHIPTIEDVKAFLIARKDIPELHLRLADYHLILFLSDFFGESVGERIILAILTQDDELVKDFVDLLL